MHPRIHNISFDCHDTYASSGFWSAVHGYARHADDAPGDPEAERLLGLGAALVTDRRHAAGAGPVSPADPEGNEFRVPRGAAERAGACTGEEQQ
ncbi:hypothetical protein [Micromonospora sp. CPCC 205561]|uniref:hypothetical protein n=1 Tax=Micromonospora sp. CPCC 205561 TaxID=3122407 RepID=UPI002FF19C09